MNKSADEPATVPRRSLRANFAWQFCANFVAAGVQFSVGSLLAKLTSDSVTGEYQIGWTITTPLFMFAALDLRVFQATETQREFAFAEYFAARLLSGLFALVTALCFAMLSEHSASALPIVGLVACLKFVDLIADCFYGAMQRHERLDLVSYCTVLRSVVQCAVFATGIITTRELVPTLIAMIVSSALTLAALELRLSRDILQVTERSNSWWLQTVSVAQLRRLLRMTTPLGIRLFLVSLIPNISRYFVSLYHGLATFGIFANISQITTIAPLFSRSMNHAIAPRLGQLCEQRDATAFRNLVFKVRLIYAAFGATAVVVTMLFGKPILSLVYREDFAPYHDVFVAVMIATAIQSVGGVLDMALVALRRAELLAPITAVTIGSMTLACWILIPMQGLKGAAMAVSVSCIVREVCLQLVLNAALRDLVRPASTQVPDAVREAA